MYLMRKHGDITISLQILSLTFSRKNKIDFTWYILEECKASELTVFFLADTRVPGLLVAISTFTEIATW